MNKLSFKRWKIFKEFADYGFGKSMDQKAHEMGGTVPFEGDSPIDPIDSELIINELKRLPPLGVFHAYEKFNDVLEWGNNVGSLQINITPLGSYRINLRRKIKDLQGENTWICKKVIPLIENEHNTNEINLAHDIYDNLKVINEEMIEGPLDHFEDFDRLAGSLTDELKRNYPAYIMFPVGTKKQNEDYYKIIFEFRGQGVEAPGRARAMQFHVDLLWDKSKGLIRSWGYDIDSDKRKPSWYVGISEWDEQFSPSQDKKEIIEAIKNCFMVY